MVATQNIQFVDLKRQYASIKNEMDAAIQHCVENTAFIGGESVKTFEARFAKMCQTKYCIACGNGTDALEIGMQALGIGAGDEVIVPANSFVASAEAVSTCGAAVVFCDAHPTSYNIDASKIEALITPKTKAIVAVHLYGRIADMDAIMDIANRHNLLVIEDSAQAHAATYKGKRAGTFGNFATFSFYPGKNLGAYGDGGAITTNDEQLFMQCKKIANHGRYQQKYNHDIVGRNSRLDGLQAAVLNVKMNHIERWNNRRFEIAQQYHALLKGMDGIICPTDEAHEKSVYHLYVVRVAADKRDALRDFLKARGIATGIHYPVSLPQVNAYQFMGHKVGDFPIADTYMDTSLSLPIFPELTTEEVQYVVENIKAFFAS